MEKSTSDQKLHSQEELKVVVFLLFFVSRVISLPEFQGFRAKASYLIYRPPGTDMFPHSLFYKFHPGQDADIEMMRLVLVLLSKSWYSGDFHLGVSFNTFKRDSECD